MARRELCWYVGLAFALTWAMWVPAGFAERGDLDLPVPSLVLTVIGGLGPMAAALIMATRLGGSSAVRVLFAQLSPRRVRGRRWYAVTTLFVPINLAPVAVHLATGGSVAPGTLAGLLVTLPVQFLLVALIGGGLDEEMGWRAFALPRALQAMGPVAANVAVGLVWSCWHLPLWIDPGSSQAAYPFALYLVTTVAQSVLIGWMYTAAGGSLLIAILAHTVSNCTDGLRYGVLADHKGELGYQLVLMSATVAAALVAIVLTRGRLGLPAPRPDGDPATKE